MKFAPKTVVLALTLAVGSASMLGCSYGTKSTGTQTTNPTVSDAATTASDAATTAVKKDIVDTAIAAGSFKTLAALLKAADFVDTLKGAGPFTVLAPTDAAFEKLPLAVRENLTRPENKSLLQQILKFHVMVGKVEASTVATLNGKNATTLSGDVPVVIQGNKIKVGGANVAATDVQASNGVIHVIDSVILPAGAFDVVDTAILDGRFGSLIAAVKAADPAVLTALRGAGPLTVFAPVDAAFVPVLAATPDLLTDPAKKATLTRVLTYHVLGTKVDAAAAIAAAGTSVTTIQGGKIAISVTGTGADTAVILNAGPNQAKVIVADVKTNNGIIHAIDKVLKLPN